MQLLLWSLLLVIPPTSCLQILFGPDASPSLIQQLPGLFPQGAPANFTICIGESTNDLVTSAEVRGLIDDGYIIRARVGANATTVAVMGNGPRALSYGAFHLLRRLGVDFLHPMHVTRGGNANWSALLVPEVREPKLAVRGSHIHAEHPNELCSMLNGFDANGKHFSRESWNKLLPEWDTYLRWLVANGQNYVEWSLLSAHLYEDYSESSERQARLKLLVAAAKSWNISVGIDATFSQTQEHGFRLWRTTHTHEADDWAEVQLRVEWLTDAGFDYIHSELGTSEMTHNSNITRLMALLNHTSAFLVNQGKHLWLENHISGGQRVSGLPDPLHPSQDINFNWMTYYLDPSIVSRPHTVQAYSLVDPAPVYGGKNFSETLDFVELMLTHGNSVVYYPETSYWCNYDTSVPLFLPVYALSRITDLQLLRGVETRAKQHWGGVGLRGQFVWESGWAWGYWLPTVVAVRSHWEDLPPASLAQASDEGPELLANMLTEIFRNLAGSLPEARQMAEVIREIAVSQRALLVQGRIPGQVPPGDVERANAFAYLIGTDAIADLLQVLHDTGIANVTTQPHRLPYRNLMHGTSRARSSAVMEYTAVVEPLLKAVTHEFNRLGTDLGSALRGPLTAQPANPLLLDLRDSMALLQLRSKQVMGLYAYAACSKQRHAEHCSANLSQAHHALTAAKPLVQAQEARYGLFAEGSQRLWAYGRAVNPSGYGRGQYWTVHSLYYWQRDQEIVAKGVVSPCFMNINDAAELYLGDGAKFTVEGLEKILRGLFHYVPVIGDLTDCLTPASKPPALAANFHEDVLGTNNETQALKEFIHI